MKNQRFAEEARHVHGQQAMYGGQMASNSRIIAFSIEIHYFLSFTNDLTYTARRPRMEAKGRQMQESLIFHRKIITFEFRK